MQFGVLALALSSLAGCGAGRSVANDPVAPAPVSPTPIPTPTPTPPAGFAGSAFSGSVLAGTLPVAGALVQVYAAGSGGNRSGAAALLSSAVVTDAAGRFTVPAQYTCPAAASQLFLVARGGSVGMRSASNPAIALFAPMGICSAVNSSTVASVSELTTAAGAWALAPFLGQGGALGTSPTNAAGLLNALRTAQALVSAANAATPPAVYAPAVLRLHTAANLLHTCVAAASDSPCAAVFAAVQPAASGSVPADTLDAMLDLVRSPGVHVAPLFQLATGSSAYSPALAAAPADWSLFLTHTGGGMNGPTAVAVDSAGDVWVASFFGVISKFSPAGEALTPDGIRGYGLNDSYGLAIDASDNVWVANRENSSAPLGSITELDPGGQPLSGAAGYTAGGLDYPIAVATDTNGSTWVVEFGNSHLTVLSPAGQPLSGAAGYGSSAFSFPVAIAVDSAHNAWVANQGGTSITRVSPDGAHILDVACCNGASGLAIDRVGDVWAANYYGDSVSRVAGTGAVISTGYTGGGLDHPQGIAIDGSGTVWVANYRGNSVSELASSGAALSPASGWLRDASLLGPAAVAIDGSGNLWLPNFGSGTLTEVIGAATPVRTPLVGPSQLP